MKKVLLPAGLVVVHVLASLINLNYFIDGGSGPTKWIHFAVTLCYLGYWLLFLKNGEVPMVGSILCTALCVVFFVGFLIVKFQLDSSLFIAIALLLTVPFSGMLAVVPAPYFWLVNAVICVIFSIFGLKCGKQQ